jgi:hypothetical protein
MAESPLKNVGNKIEKQEDLQKLQELMLHQEQLDNYEKQKNQASFMVYSEFIEVLFKFACHCNQDKNKNDVVKFKEFLMTEVFSSLKYQLRLKKGEEDTKPHKMRVLRMLQKLQKVY